MTRFCLLTIMNHMDRANLVRLYLETMHQGAASHNIRMLVVTASMSRMRSVLNHGAFPITFDCRHMHPHSLMRTWVSLTAFMALAVEFSSSAIWFVFPIA